MFGEKTVRSLSHIENIKNVFRRLSLRTQLLLILLFVLAISLGALFVIYARTEEMLIEKVTANLDDLTTAIQTSVEELTQPGDSSQRLKGYVEILKKRGIRDIDIIGDDSQVIASSNPTKIGTKENPRNLRKAAPGQEKTARKKDIVITARLGEESKNESQRIYNAIMPVSIKGKSLGIIRISMILDDYKYLQRRNQLKRILATLFAFTIGIIVSLILADQYTDPIKKIAKASKKIAQGKLVKIRDSNRKDEIGVLVRSFNDMVDKLGERKELEDRLKKTEQLSMIGQLASGIAHEVRNPLNFLSLSIGHIKERLAEEGMSKSDDINDLLDNLRKEIYRVNELINNFLFLGKPIVLNREWVLPEALMEDALYMVRDKVRDAIDIRTASPEDRMSIFCDRDYMRLCLINLILNSAQAIEDRGSITVRFDIENGMACIAVTDNGKGVEGEDMEKVFEPYYSTKKLGIGLGLTITKRLVEEHGGTISAESIPGERTTVTIKVPNHAVS
jgi:hypothetical protein